MTPSPASQQIEVCSTPPAVPSPLNGRFPAADPIQPQAVDGVNTQKLLEQTATHQQTQERLREGRPRAHGPCSCLLQSSCPPSFRGSLLGALPHPTRDSYAISWQITEPEILGEGNLCYCSQGCSCSWEYPRWDSQKLLPRIRGSH